MEEQSAPSVSQAAPEASTLGSRLFNVFSSPGEVFAGLKGAQKSSGNWVVPVLLGIVVSVVFMLVVFGRPSIQQQMIDTQRAQFEKQIQAGKMTQEQADTAEQFSRPGSVMFTLFGSIGAGVMTVIMVLLVALIYWLIGKFVFKAPLGYGTSLEAVGLAYMTMVLGSVISILTILALDSMYATPSLALLIGQFDVNNGLHKFLSQMNIFTIWFVVLLGISLTKLADASAAKAMIWVFGLFLVISAVFSFVI